MTLLGLALSALVCRSYPVAWDPLQGSARAGSGSNAPFTLDLPPDDPDPSGPLVLAGGVLAGLVILAFAWWLAGAWVSDLQRRKPRDRRPVRHRPGMRVPKPLHRRGFGPESAPQADQGEAPRHAGSSPARIVESMSDRIAN